jgi:hypothetical protein
MSCAMNLVGWGSKVNTIDTIVFQNKKGTLAGNSFHAGAKKTREKKEIIGVG